MTTPMTKPEAEALWKYATDEERRDVRRSFTTLGMTTLREFANDESSKNRQHWQRVLLLACAAIVILGGDERDVHNAR